MCAGIGHTAAIGRDEHAVEIGNQDRAYFYFLEGFEANSTVSIGNS